jgi:sodium-dependent dicarboxylate transporter 2/3/5
VGWLAFGVPLTVVGVAVLYVVLTRGALHVRAEGLPGGDAFIAAQRTALGPLRPEERRIALVFGGVSVLWILSPLLSARVPGLSDAGIAVAGALLLFALPSRPGGPPLLDWHAARGLPWGVLLLFGGGLSLASAIADTGLATWIGDGLASAAALPPWVLVGLVVLVIILLTELTSNTATAAAFLPVLAALATSTGTPPLMLLVPTVAAASCAFMLPVATPPNAIVYGTGHVSIAQMARTGAWLNAAFVVVVTVLTLVLVPLLTGTALPDLAPARP